MAITKILSGHYSQESAYLVSDYPYGFSARCSIRYWIENNSKGSRLWSQTTNPKKGDIWNKAKSSTYNIVGAMFLDENNHVQWSGLSVYSLEDTQKWLDTYREGLLPAQIKECEALIAAYERHKAAKEVRERLAESNQATAMILDSIPKA